MITHRKEPQWSVWAKTLTEIYRDVPRLSQAIVAHNKKADGYQIALNKKVWRQMMRELIILRRAEKLVAKEMNRNNISGYAPGQGTAIRSQILFLEDLRAAFHGQDRIPRVFVYRESAYSWSLVELYQDGQYFDTYVSEASTSGRDKVVMPGMQKMIAKSKFQEQPDLMIDYACSINHKGRHLIISSTKRP